MIIPNLDGAFEDIFDITGDENAFHEHFIDDSVENFIDSRLDVDSVLIDDIKLEQENLIFNDQSQQLSGFYPSKDDHLEHFKGSEDEGSLSPGFEQRDRCNTWPRVLMERPGNLQDWAPAGTAQNQTQTPVSGLESVNEETDHETMSTCDTSDTCEIGFGAQLGDNSSQATGSVYGRRNPWGNQSYADLITQAITSCPERRMTLSQIYEWMVAQIPYFTERQSNSKSAGWKNSIRHNLSLHQKFVKIPNEGAGKSSWWTVNLENSQIKKQRRRATSGDVKLMSSRRERVRSKTESMKNSEKLSRSFSSAGILSSNSGNLASSSFDGSAFSVFRSRNMSTTSTTSLESCGINMDELVSSELGNIWNDETTDDIGDFSLNNLDMNNQTNQTSAEQQNIHHSMQSSESKQKLKILEPRDIPRDPQYLNSRVNFIPPLSILEEPPSDTRIGDMDSLRIADEERKSLIINQLEMLKHKKMTTDENVDHSIMMLEEQLQIMIQRLEKNNQMATILQNINDDNYCNAKNVDIDHELCDYPNNPGFSEFHNCT